MGKRDSDEVWIARDYSAYVFLRVVVVFALLWAGIGSFLYGFLLDYLGWKGLSLEVQWTLFVALSLVITAIIVGVAAGTFLLIRKIVRAW